MITRRRYASIAWCLFLGNLFVAGRLIRPMDVYEAVIKGMHDYFNNTCIILLHGTRNPIETQGLDEGQYLLELQRYFSGPMHTRTAIMDLHMFRTRVGFSYYHIKRPLFVLLNDDADVQREFAHVNISSGDTVLLTNTLSVSAVLMLEIGVSTWIAMAYPTWLIFFSDGTKIEDFFGDIYVPFDCKMMIARKSQAGGGEIIHEIYQVDRGQVLRKAWFGGWNRRVGFYGPRNGLYVRRNNLFGHTLRIASVDDPPASVSLKNFDGNMTGIKGFYGEVLKLLQEIVNCTLSFKEADSWGILLRNGTWTGAIGMLVRNEADLVANELMMTADRMDAIDFTTPVYSTKCRTYIKKPASQAVKWEAYTAPFEANIWGSLGILIVVASVTITSIKAIIKVLSFYLADYENAPSKLMDVMFCVFGAFCNQGMEPSLLDPVRMVHLVIHLTAVVVLAAYSAALISFLAVKTFVMPFTTMAGLLEDGTYRFGVVGDSADYSFFMNTTDKVLGVLFDELLTKEKQLPVNYLDGLKKVCAESKYAFMTVDNMASVLKKKVNCKLEPLDTIAQITVAMAVQNNSPYRELINTNILLLRDSGILQRLLKLEWTADSAKSESGWTTVELGDILPLLLFMIGSFFFCSVLLCLEQVTYQQLVKRFGTRHVIKRK